jgi:predicted ATP-grasp superfamily ATP-dependent carboligase
MGASVRAAAQSARDAGFDPSGIDHYADRDLRRIAGSIRLEHDAPTAEFERLARSLPPGPFLYTGPLENEPDLIDTIALDRPLWGQPGRILRLVRDPHRLAFELDRGGFRFPEIRQRPTLDEGPWLLKPYASGGGLRIEHWNQSERSSVPEGFCLQRQIRGTPISAIFLGDDERTRLVGITRQILSAGPNPFLYLGSFGPWPIAESLRTETFRLGRMLAATFGLRGLFGVDMIQNRGSLWVIEVNPRYTASVEILEWTTGLPLMAEHARCFQPIGGVISPNGRPKVAFAAKQTILTSRDWVMPASDLPLFPLEGPLPGCWFSDLPEPGERFAAGQPVLTLNVTGRTEAEVQASLEDRLASWSKALGLG